MSRKGNFQLTWFSIMKNSCMYYFVFAFGEWIQFAPKHWYYYGKIVLVVRQILVWKISIQLVVHLFSSVLGMLKVFIPYCL